MTDFVKALAQGGHVPESDLETAISLISDQEQLWRSLVTQNIITEDQVFRDVAAYYQQQFVDVSNLSIPADAITLLPSSFCRERNIIPLGVQGDYIFVGMIAPDDLATLDELKAMVNYTLAPKVVAPTPLMNLMNRYFRVDSELDMLQDQMDDLVSAGGEIDDEPSDVDDAPVVRFVDLFINQAINDRASDIHVEPGARDIRIRYRIDGVLKEMQRPARNIQDALISRLKVMSEIDIAEKRKPQDGRMTRTHSGRKVDIRVSTLPTIFGEKIVMRILDHSTMKTSISSMGLSPRNLEIFQDAIRRTHGMVLVTGPTGSGKTTSLYTALDEIIDPKINILTVEDPVEKKITGVNQTQINTQANYTFSSALRAILRQDPDVVLLGEIRDEETAGMAVEASLTGHLVLSTLHTNGAPEAIPRLVEMGVEPYLVGTSVSCVVAQRLARRLCDRCKLPDENVDEEFYRKVGFARSTEEIVYRPVGCTHCSDTGFRGRVAVMEVMRVTEDIERLTVDRAPASAIRAAAEADGFVSLRQDGFDKVRQGLTTVAEILRTTT